MKKEAMLVRLPNWIGDAAMAAPTLAALADLRPEVELHLVGTAPVLELFRGFDEPFVLTAPLGPQRDRPDRLLAAARRLRRLHAESALLLTPSFSGALLAWLSGAKLRVGWATDGRGALLNLTPAVPNRTTHLRAQYHELAHGLARRAWDLDLPAPGENPRLPLRAEEIAWADAAWDELGLDPDRTIALAPGATYGATKRWPEERFSALARELARRGYDVVWCGGAAEAELAARLTTSLEDAGLASANLTGRHRLRETLAFLARARAVVSNDSGAMHLAQAAGAPVVGIFGSTSPAWTGPIGAESRVARHPVECSPCFARRCPTAIECLRDLEVEAVLAAVQELVQTPREPGEPALFLDRDGTLLELVSYLSRPEEVKLAPGAGPALRAMRRAGYRLVVITNQSIVARGELDRAGLWRVHLRVRELLREEGVQLDAIEVCPHHPDFTGPCHCRKPEPGMLRRAAHRLKLDLSRSLLVGDHATDLEAAVRAGVRPILIGAGYGRETDRALGGMVSGVRYDTIGGLDELAQRFATGTSPHS